MQNLIVINMLRNRGKVALLLISTLILRLLSQINLLILEKMKDHYNATTIDNRNLSPERAA